jgi:hypothetical protein
VIALTYFAGLYEPKGKRRSATWRALCAWLSNPVIAPAKEEAPGFSVATYADDYRKLANVEQVYAIGLDIDEDLSLEDLRQKFATSSAFVHTTWSSTIDAPRCRVFLELSRPVSAEEYRRVYTAVCAIAESDGLVIDRQASDPSRFWFRPSVREVGCSYIYWLCEGAPIDVEAALRAVPPPVAFEAPPRAPLAAPDRARAYERASKYLAKCEPAIQGSGGSNATLKAAICMTRGFALEPADAFDLMAREYNPRCQPPWSEQELRRKVEHASGMAHFPLGDLLERDRR